MQITQYRETINKSKLGLCLLRISKDKFKRNNKRKEK